MWTTGPSFVEQIRSSRHVLRATSDNYIRIAALNCLCSQSHGFEARTTYFIDGGGPNPRREARSETDLPGDVLAQASADHIPKNHLFCVAGCNSGSL
jgi:hypothetical protein